MFFRVIYVYYVNVEMVFVLFGEGYEIVMWVLDWCVIMILVKIDFLCLFIICGYDVKLLIVRVVVFKNDLFVVRVE